MLNTLEMAGSTGLEPAASAVTGQRSNQLNYDPAMVFTGLAETLVFTGASLLSTVSPVSPISAESNRFRCFMDSMESKELPKLARLWQKSSSLTEPL